MYPHTAIGLGIAASVVVAALAGAVPVAGQAPAVVLTPQAGSVVPPNISRIVPENQNWSGAWYNYESI